MAVDMEWLRRRTAERLAELRAAQESEQQQTPEFLQREAARKQEEARRQSKREALVSRFGPGWQWSPELEGFKGPSGEYVREGLAEDWILQRDMDNLAAQLGTRWKWVHGSKAFKAPWATVARYTVEEVRQYLKDKPPGRPGLWQLSQGVECLRWVMQDFGFGGQSFWDEAHSFYTRTGFGGFGFSSTSTFEEARDRYHRREQQRQAPPPRHTSSAWWTVLEVQAFCTWDQARAAYRALAKKYHEAVGGDQEKMKQVNAAWDECKKHFGKRG